MRQLSQKINLPFVTAEDGFLRSLDSGIESKYAASFVIDDCGIYFDLNKPNQLQDLIFQTIKNWDIEKYNSSQYLINKISQFNLSKYNIQSKAPNLSDLAGNDKPHIIIVDQVQGDASVVGAGASSTNFSDMLIFAKRIYPNANIWIKAHPAGKGYFNLDQAIDGDIFYLNQPCNTILLLKQAHAVFTVSSHMGFEALLLGKIVHCFGVNWYSGFSLTQDNYLADNPLYHQVSALYQNLAQSYQVERNVSAHQLFYASYLLYSRYADPATASACSIDETMNYLILNKEWQSKLEGKILAYDFSRWKIPFVQGFLGFPKTELKFSLKKFWARWSNLLKRIATSYDNCFVLSQTLQDYKYVTWGLKSKQALAEKLLNMGKSDPKIWCMEDGFIRSNGLGASLIAPLSVVMDDVGIYYDANHPSRLEQILTQISLTDEQKNRAKHLQTLMLTKRVSKYNISTKNHEFADRLANLKTNRPHKSVHLVVGQVEDDASLQNCASVIKKNSENFNSVFGNPRNPCTKGIFQRLKS